MNSPGKDPCELAEVVYEKPLSGVFEEKLFGSDRGNTLWVKFSDKLGINEWIGKFGTGVNGPTRVEKADDPDKFFICAGGFGYLVEATHRKLLAHHCDEFSNDIAYDLKTNRFIVADFSRLRVIESGQMIWASERIALDGISGFKVEGRLIKGMAVTGFEGKESSFTFNLDSFEIRFDRFKDRWKLW